MISITTAEDEADLRAIMALQYINLKQNTPMDARVSDGFVTVQHRYDVLQRMNMTMPSIIAKYDTFQLIGYALAMLPEFALDVPELRSLFSMIKILKYDGKPLETYSYYVIGQSCVAAGFRGRKVLARMLEKHREMYSDRYQLLITSISEENPRSLRAHISAGFIKFCSFCDEKTKEIWHILIWDWCKENTAPLDFASSVEVL